MGGLIVTYAEALKRFRHEFKLTQKQVADTARIFTQAYQVYEYGREPSVSMLCKLADTYNISLDYLTGRTDNPQISR